MGKKVTVPPGSLAERLRRARNDLGLEQSDIAERIGKSGAAGVGYVSRLETGATANPRAEELVLLARACGVTVDWLLTGEGASQGNQIDVKLLAHLIAALRDEVDDERLARAIAIEYKAIVSAHATPEARQDAVQQAQARYRTEAEFGAELPLAAHKKSTVRRRVG